MGDIDVSDLIALAAQLGEAGRQVERQTYPVVEEHAAMLRNTWRKNARKTAGKHGKHYPRSITAEQIPVPGEALWEVGPETRRKQGGMGRGFEYGSRNQPPHWDGARAVVDVEPKLVAALDKLMRGVL